MQGPDVLWKEVRIRPETGTTIRKCATGLAYQHPVGFQPHSRVSLAVSLRIWCEIVRRLPHIRETSHEDMAGDRPVYDVVESAILAISSPQAYPFSTCVREGLRGASRFLEFVESCTT